LLVREAVEKPVGGLDNIISGVAHAGADWINPAGAGVCGLFTMPDMLPAWYAGRTPQATRKVGAGNTAKTGFSGILLAAYRCIRGVSAVNPRHFFASHRA